MPTTGVRVDIELLVRLRKGLRLSQSEVARQLELHENYYQRVEAGKARISLALLSTLETYFGLDPRANELVHPVDRDQFRRTPALPS
jgi:transcriptional regulator with XRE-family HTH domain